MWPFRMFSHRRGLRMWILSLLESSPKNGAELMDAMEEMSQGWWRPSPGSVYPLLEQLVKEGVVEKQADNRYALTEKGRMDYVWPPWMSRHRPQNPEGIISDINANVSYLEDLSTVDREKLAANMDRIVKLRDRLSTLVQKGGEKE